MDYTPRACIACGASFVPARAHQKRCSPCSRFKSKKRDAAPVPKACAQCGLEFQPKMITANYCSAKCQQRARYAANPYNPETFGTGGRANKGVPQSREHVECRIKSLASTLAAVKRDCVKCGESYTPTTAAQKYCSGRCWNAVARAKRERLHRIKITPEHYAVLLDKQGGKCRICGVAAGANTRRERLAVDHCHSTGKVRGLLCHRCNTALGLFYDRRESLAAAIEYLAEAEARN